MNKKAWKPQLPPFSKHKKEMFSQVGVTADFIFHIGESDNLQKPSKEVPLNEITSETTKKKIAYLKRCMRRYRKLTGMGRGIVGVQIGIPEQIIVVYLPAIGSGRRQVQAGQTEKQGKLLILINPHITKESTKLLRYSEICMSASPLIAPVVRPAWIEFEYFDEQGQKQIWKTKDTTKLGRLYNRVFEHEIDHIRGMINIDRVASNELVYACDPSFYDKATFEEVKKA